MQLLIGLIIYFIAFRLRLKLTVHSYFPPYKFCSIQSARLLQAGKLVASGCSTFFTLFLHVLPASSVAPFVAQLVMCSLEEHVLECLPPSFGTLPVASIIEFDGPVRASLCPSLGYHVDTKGTLFLQPITASFRNPFP